MAKIRARNVSKTFRAKGTIVEAVKHVDVDIGEGEFAVFVGPSGSGKTTFLRLVAGLELPSSGQIWIGDRDVTTVHPRARGDRDGLSRLCALPPHDRPPEHGLCPRKSQTSTS